MVRRCMVGHWRKCGEAEIGKAVVVVVEDSGDGYRRSIENMIGLDARWLE